MLMTTLLSCLSPHAAGAATAPGAGWIEGTVTGAKDAWVYLDDQYDGANGPRGKAPPPMPPILSQQGRTFSPPVLVVVAGTTVDFPNLGPEWHDVNWVTPQYSDQLGTYAPNQSRQRVFHEPGLYPIGCNRHAEMSAHVLVVPSDRVAKVGPDGRYTIPDVPPGKYHIRAWSIHRSASSELDLDVVEGQGASFDAHLGG